MRISAFSRVVKMVSFVTVFIFANSSRTLADVGIAFDGPDADPIALLNRVGENVSHIGVITMTTYVFRDGNNEKRLSERKYRLEPQDNKVEITFGKQKWSVDINDNKCVIQGNGKSVEVPLSDMTSMQPPSLAAFAPISPSIFNTKEIYGGYDFKIIDNILVGNHAAAILEGSLPNAVGSGKVQLFIDVQRGLLLTEKYYASSGVLVRETDYRDYQSFNGTFIPMKVAEHHIARKREERITTIVEGVSVRTNGAGVNNGRGGR